MKKNWQNPGCQRFQLLECMVIGDLIGDLFPKADSFPWESNRLTLYMYVLLGLICMYLEYDNNQLDLQT